MTDDTQKSPAGESSPTPKRPRRTSTKKAESPVNPTESASTPPSSASDKSTAKTKTAKAPASKTTRSRSTKATSADAADSSPTGAPADNSPESKDSAAAAASKTTAPSRRRASSQTSPKTSKTTKAAAIETEDSAAPQAQDASPEQQKISAPKTTSTKAKTPAKRGERRPAAKSRAQAPLAEQAPTQFAEQAPEQFSEQNSAPSSITSQAPASASEAATQAPSAVISSGIPEISPVMAPASSIISLSAPLAPPLSVKDALPVAEAEGTEAQAPAEAPSATTDEDEAPARKSRRGRRGGRGRSKNKAREAQASADAVADDTDADSPEGSASDEEGATPAPKARQKPAARAQARPAKGAAPSAAADAATDIDDDDEAPRGPEKVGRRKMFISVVPGEQVEVALVEEGAIHEYYLEMLHQAKTKGNIYKGVIHNIDTNLQAAFVNYGTNKNGFLQIDEVHPEYYLNHHEAIKGKKFPPMQKVLKAGQEVLVQVVKEPSGSKGAFLTTWLSLAGRFLVLTPGQEQIGVSRKVENDEERARLREMMNGIDPGEGLGVIVRTVSAGTSKTTLKNDLHYLKRVWKDIRKRGTTGATPSLIYQEPGLAERAVRDYLTDDVCEVWVDDGPEAEILRETVSLLFPRKGDLVHVHNDLRQTLWERFNIQRQLEQIYSREVTLPSGGRLVFDQTEALMAIDINSGKISGKGNFEAMALRTNVEAAECIARQLKLRDIGGQIVIDFIEMRDKNHIREVEKTLRNAMKNDRARHDVARMSSFGLLEIVRQRTASSALAITMEPCPACGGTGLRRNIEWQSLQVMREIARLARTCTSGPCQIELTTELGLYLLNHKRDRLREMEKQYNVPIEIKIRP